MSTLTTEMVQEYAIPSRDGQRIAPRPKGAIANIKSAELERRDSELPRSASYTHMSDARSKDSSSFSLDHSSVSETDFTTTPGDTSGDVSPLESNGVNTPDERFNAAVGNAPQPQALIQELQKVPQVVEVRPVSQEKTKDGVFNFSSIRYQPPRPLSDAETSNTASTPTTPNVGRSVTSNFSRKINRRSWLGTKSSEPSRSPSPQKKENLDVSINAAPNGISSAPVSPVGEGRKSLPKRKESLKPQSKPVTNESRAESQVENEPGTIRKSTTLRKKRPTSGWFKNSSSDNETVTLKSTRPPTRDGQDTAIGPPAVQEVARPTQKPKRLSLLPLPKSFSTEKLPHYQFSDNPLSPTAPTPVPRLLSSERIPKGGFVAPKKKDELWSVFRGLDADFSKFSSKSVAFKANVVRNSLIPFLRSYSTHASNKKLRAEDLDRRVNILNKWWTGLIELLHGRNNQSISGTDRPAILDGIAGIMERPEWRLPPSPLSPLSQRLKGTASPRNRSTTSLGSEASDFLTDSVHHNVRNIFIQNLSAQMAFVVDKMSLRNASASLVSFCGKACAFAFMFVPGMADILVRLWDLQTPSVRRILEGNGIGKFEKLAETSSSIASNFPPALQPLAFTSLTKYMRMLRTTPTLPLGTAHIQWYGRWLDRWSGRESDLFYVFVKYFHILATDFLPADSTDAERMCAPGFLLVHAQILTNLDATIHRDANQTQQDSAGSGPASSFDEMFGDPDAVAATLPMPPATNATRLMSENRLIMLIRDFLSERAAEYPAARRIFADSFNKLLQTAARGTSMFDHAACYTLLDFLEEALVLLVRFEKVIETDGALVDLDFWMVVWRKMIESENTMTQIRLYAFLYTVWNTVVCELGRKQDLCDQILLDPAVFSSQFNHYSPMVRAYFMRILCWRVGRVDGEYCEADLVLLERLWEKLHTTWSHHLYLREQARIQDTQSPPTNPCNPAPSRRLLIIRTDPQISPAGTYLSFDGIVPPRTPTDANTPLAMKRSSTISSISSQMELHARPDTSLSVSSDSTELEVPRGRTSTSSIGGFIKNLITPKGRSKSQSRSPAKPPAEDAPAVPQLQRAATDDFTSQTRPSAPPVTEAAAAGAQPPQFRAFTFKFSLEYHPHARPLPPMRLQPPRLPPPAQQLLQNHSHVFNTTSPSRHLRPEGECTAHARYAGRALAEWAIVLGECASFFERRKGEGVPGNKAVETPGLGVEVFRRPG